MIRDAAGAQTADAGVDPFAATTSEQFVVLLRQVRHQSGLSMRTIARNAEAQGHVLPPSTLATMLHRTTLPRQELVTALLTACGIPVPRQAAWLDRWRRLARERASARHEPRRPPAVGVGPTLGGAGAVGGAPTPAASGAATPGAGGAAGGAPTLGAGGVPTPGAGGAAGGALPRAGGIPRQLPAMPGPFAGRGRELARLSAALDAHDTVVISAVTGTGGVGKTWLALRWAHDNLDRYPDGQVYLNLRGFDPSDRPVPPEEALRALLQALGVAPAAIPTGQDAQTGLYRSLVAGRRMLIVLDNARDAAQVGPLLPGAAGCAVIVTSRRHLTSLAATDGADLLALDLLDPADARRLLVLRLGEGRLATEPAATAEIIDRCDRLPLALALVAARAAGRPQWTLAALADELRCAEDRLDALTSDTPAADLRTVFACSYRALSPDAARLFRLLGLHPGPDISAPAAASLAGLPPRRVRRLLAELAGAHLVTEHVPQRFTLHDLLRVYATELARAHDTEQQRGAAVCRMLDHYLHSAYAASLLLAPNREPITVDPPAAGVSVERLADGAAAMCWFAAELRVLVGAVHTAGTGFEAHAWRLADALGGFFSRQGHWHDWQNTAWAAWHAARRAGDPRAEARADCWLAELYAWIGRHDDTAVHLDRAGRIFDRLADTAGLAYVHLCRGWVYEPRRLYREALHHTEQALRLYTIAGHKHGQANALNNIGWYHGQLGDYLTAIMYSRRALIRHQQLGSRSWEGRTWESLGYAHHRLGHFERAGTCYRRAADLFHDLGSRYYEAKVLNRLGDAHRDAGEPEPARRAWQRACDILHQLQHDGAHHIRAKLAHRPEALRVNGWPATDR